MPESNLIPLAFENQPIRASDDGRTLFVAEDVCLALGISKHRDAVAKLDEDERGSLEVDTLGGRQTVAAVTEAGVYTLALRCRDAMKPGTAPYKFRKWVTGTALPALRRGHEPAGLSGGDKGAIGGIVKGVLNKALGELLPAMVAAELGAHRYNLVEGVSALEIADILGYPAGRRPRGLSQFISRRVTRWHEDRGVAINRSRHGWVKVKLFNEGSARQWIAAGGKSEVDAYVAERRGQGKLTLVLHDPVAGLPA